MKLSLRIAAIGVAAVSVLATPGLSGAQTQRDESRSVDRVSAHPQPAKEELRLRCAGRSTDNGRSAVACNWTRTERRDAAGYSLVRTNGDVRTVVFATRDLSQTRAIDTEIRLDVKYTYLVQVHNEAGRTIGSGGPVSAGVRSPQHKKEVLQIECAQLEPSAAVKCAWRPATHPDAVGYQLWRVVDRGQREGIWRGDLTTTAHTSRVPMNAQVARYAVLSVDKSGTIVGQSRPFTVRIRNTPTIDVRPSIDREPRSGNIRFF
jgi:hypothetical protein